MREAVPLIESTIVPFLLFYVPLRYAWDDVGPGFLAPPLVAAALITWFIYKSTAEDRRRRWHLGMAANYTFGGAFAGYAIAVRSEATASSGAFLVLGLAVAALLIFHLLESVRPPDPRIGSMGKTPTRHVTLAPGARAVWTAQARDRWAAVASKAFALMVWTFSAPWIILGARNWSHLSYWGGIVAVALLGLIFYMVLPALEGVKVVVTQQGVSIRASVLPFPKRFIPIDAIVGATVDDVRAARFGGTGWRRGVPDNAVIMRSGEALRIEVDDEADVIVTVDGADEGAALINELVRR